MVHKMANKNNIFDNDEYILKMNITGIKWGIACNSLHFIDAFNFTQSNAY